MPASEPVDARLLSVLACPRDHAALDVDAGHLCCPHGHRYPVVAGIPVFLLAEQTPTIGIAEASLRVSEQGAHSPLYVETLGLSDEQRRGVERDWRPDAKIDAAISYLIGATSGLAYLNQIGRLDSYPIPDIPIPADNGGLLLDVGCNWGRWSVSAARKGWTPVGIDPSLGALAAAKRAFGASGQRLHFVCADARFLPFKAGSFRGVFSYSVLQHFSEPDAQTAIAEIGRVLAGGGFAKIQMAHRGGLRARMHAQAHNTGSFRVRYWSLEALEDVFTRLIGPSRLVPEAFGGLGLLAGDWRVASTPAKLLICASAVLKALAAVVPPLIRIADSVYIEARKA